MKRTFLSGLFLLLFATLYAQGEVHAQLLKSIPEAITANKHSSVAEKVYLHFDNTAYYKGDKIWFKAYVLTADRNLPGVLSKVLYVDLLTPEGVVAETRKYKIEDGSCNGSFTLTDSLLSGYYEVRAYTRFMLNDGNDAVFSRVFPVFDKPAKPGAFQNPQMRALPSSKRLPSVRPELKTARKPQMSFYPEGGHLVKGLTTRVAFELTGEDGRPVAATGYVFSEKNDTLAEFTTGHLGRGQFMLTPVSGKCTVRCFIDKEMHKFQLPEAEQEGVAMTVDRAKDCFSVLIQKSLGYKTDLFGLTVTSRGHLFASDQVRVDSRGGVLLNLPYERIPSGVSQLTLYDDQGSILAQRCVFVNHHKKLNITLASDSGKATPFSPIRLDIKVEAPSGEPLRTDISLAVRDASFSPYNKYAETLFSNLLLSSELKGFIENPGYYFEKDDARHQLDLDVLLMIQGWSRFKWNYLAGIEQNPLQQEIEDQLYIDGKVHSVFKNKPLQGIDMLMIQMMDSTSQNGRCTTDEKGRFLMGLNDFYGKSTLILQTTQKGKKKNTSILLNRFVRPDVRAYSLAEKLVPASDTSFIHPDTLAITDTLSLRDKISLNNSQLPMDKKIHVLKEVRIKGNRRIQRYEEAIRNSGIIYDVEKTVDELVDQTGNEPSGVMDYLSAMNPYFNYSEPGQLAALYKGRKVFFVLNGTLVDGSNGDFFNSLTPGMLQLVTIAESTQLALTYAPNDPGLALGKEGVVIFIYTNPAMKDRTSPNGMRRTTFYGYDRPEAFYHPYYGSYSLPDEQDFRRTLYWNPSVKTNEKGNATVRFWNNSRARGFVVSAETVSENGAPGSLLMQIQPE